MKVSGPSSVSTSVASKGARPASTGGFSVGGTSAAAPAAMTSAASAVSSLDALMALQEVGGPLERRRRAMNRASRILDVLDEIKLGLMDGDLTPQTLERLTRAVRNQREATDDPGLEALLNEIETRAAVESAKLEVSLAAT